MGYFVVRQDQLQSSFAENYAAVVVVVDLRLPFVAFAIMRDMVVDDGGPEGWRCRVDDLGFGLVR